MATKVTKQQRVLSRQQFLRYLNDDMNFCGLTEATKRQYHLVVNRYLDFTSGNPDFSRSEIMQFIDSLGNVTSTYKAWMLSLIKRFHKTIRDYLPDEQKKWPLGPRDGPKVLVRPQPAFDVTAINKLFRVIKNNRDYAIARLLFATGMRRDEICRLTKDSYNNPNIIIGMAKGEEYRTVKLDNTTCLALDEYLLIRQDNYSSLFLNDHSKPFTPDALSQVFKKYFNRIDADERTGLHSFRRGLVTLLYNRGMGETEIQKFIGWKTSEMVRKYIQFAPGRISEDVIAIHPFYENNEKEEDKRKT